MYCRWPLVAGLSAIAAFMFARLCCSGLNTCIKCVCVCHVSRSFSIFFLWRGPCARQQTKCVLVEPVGSWFSKLVSTPSENQTWSRAPLWMHKHTTRRCRRCNCTPKTWKLVIIWAEIFGIWIFILFDAKSNSDNFFQSWAKLEAFG